MFQTKVAEQIKHTFYVQKLFPENHAVYEIMWKNIVERGRPEMTIWRMRFACWIPKATNTHSECVILIAFPRQQWLRERASVLRLRTLPVLFKIRKSVGGCICYSSSPGPQNLVALCNFCK